MAQGWKTLVAATVMLLALLDGNGRRATADRGTRRADAAHGRRARRQCVVRRATSRIAYNPDRDEFFVVFAGRTPDFPVEQEIYGLALDGAGRPRSGPVRLTSVSGDASVGAASALDVVYAGTGTTKRYVASYLRRG